jgi:hypothetical protein
MATVSSSYFVFETNRRLNFDVSLQNLNVTGHDISEPSSENEISEDGATEVSIVHDGKTRCLDSIIYVLLT